MSALPPLPDHRPAVLRALDTLGCHQRATGANIGTIAGAGDLLVGEAWLAVTQCAQAGLVRHDDHGRLREDLTVRTWWLTSKGRAIVEAFDCPKSPLGQHQTDTSMEEGPHHCFHCGINMRGDLVPAEAGDEL